MSAIQVTITIPPALAQQADEAGLLTDEGIATLLSDELERQREFESFWRKLERLRAVSDPLSEDEVTTLVNEEIRAARAEKNALRHANDV